MPNSPWWTTISTAELLALRRRLVAHVRAEFGDVLGTEVEDVVQHAFVVLFKRRTRVSADEDGLYRYLDTVARNAARDRVKAIKQRQKPLPEAALRRGQHASKGAVPAPPPEEAAQENEKIWEIFCALGDLDRLILWYHVVEGQSIRAIARDLDLSWHDVAGVIEGALRAVRKKLTS